MATLAFGHITGFSLNPGDGGMQLQLSIHRMDGTQREDGVLSPWYDIDAMSTPALNTAIKAFVKQWTIDHWSMTYGGSDVARLIFEVVL